MAKLMCCKISHNPYEEEFVTEIPEKVFEIDGYQVADRMLQKKRINLTFQSVFNFFLKKLFLEGVIFEVTFDDSGVTDVKIAKSQTKEWFEDNFNSKKFYNMVKETAQVILDEGDEVDIPDWLKEKYYKNGINVAYINP
jgi:hypothetical protein